LGGLRSSTLRPDSRSFGEFAADPSGFEIEDEIEIDGGKPLLPLREAQM